MTVHPRRKTRRRATYICIPDLTPVSDERCSGHTPSPSGYIAWHQWAEKMEKTHNCNRCPECGLWAIWTPIHVTT